MNKSSLPFSQPTTPADLSQDILNNLPRSDFIKPSLIAAGMVGDSGSRDSLKRLEVITDKNKLSKTLKTLRAALKALHRNDWKKGAELAQEALKLDAAAADAWHILAITQEKQNLLEDAFHSYEQALKIRPHNLPVANDLGRLAYRLGHLPICEKLFSYVLRHEPDNEEAANNLATSLRDRSQFEDAIDILRNALHFHPQSALLWNAIGTVVETQGDLENARIFYNEAITYEPHNSLALYNMGNTLRETGDFEESISHLKKALPHATTEERNKINLSISFSSMCMGRFAWDYYEGRLYKGTDTEIIHLINRPQWTPEIDINGKHVFICGEQGLGDEVLFGSLLPDLIRDVGPSGKITLAVEPRLVSLFARSFPEMDVIGHITVKWNQKRLRGFSNLPDPNIFDAWTLLAEPAKKYRNSVADFPAENVFLKPDPERVAYWKAELAKLDDGPKIGILWKSLIKHSQRDRHYSPFEQWKPLLHTPGAHFINLQYGDASAELAEAEREGLKIWNPQGIDLTKDLDDLCALCRALDLVIAPPNATSNLAAAAGVKVWKFSAAHSWVRLGTDYYPWYPTVRAFKYYNYDWSAVIQEIREALIKEFNLIT
ncbi:tetratricopeptide repeat protein [Asticcacaulis tiandongensis]|uniref:tetratricopeptide repeat protein n=1 Tax=Asticcacaulis tiandongensis TaxID=2565365 RepID=UPI0015E839A6|nr:tetratricopeptide repeat protein [Asticcacaulis tiandongensis]